MIHAPRPFTLSDGGAELPAACRGHFPVGSHAFDAAGRRRHLLMLGGSLLQLPAIRMAKEEGWAVILADGNPQALARPWVDHFEPIDLKDREGMLEMARRWHAQGKLHGVFTAATDFSATVARVTEALGLPGIPLEAALNASSKLRMRRIFQAQGIPSPRFVELAAGQEWDREALARLSLPVVVKPIDNMGARGVRRLDDWSGLEPAVADARGHSRQGSILIEEFIEGPEYSIDSLVVDGRLVPCGLALRHIRFSPCFIEVGHTLPSDLSPEQVESLVAVFGKAVAALGITRGAAKGDVFFTPRGPMIGEIAARLSGGYMSGWTYPLASGIELTRAALYQAMGLPLPSLEPLLKQVSAERAFISIPGKLRAWEGLAGALAPEALRHFFPRAAAGDRVVFPRNNVEKAGNVIAVGPDAESAAAVAEAAVAGCRLRLAAPDQETEAFLFAPQPGQHSAYPGLLSVLPLPRDLPAATAALEAVPGLMAARDWSWRSLAQSLAALEPAMEGLAADAAAWERFWLALARGGLQGASYVLDCREAGK